MLSNRNTSRDPGTACAPQGLLKQYEKAKGGANVHGNARLRKALGDDECPICYEYATADEEQKCIVTFCMYCGANLHKECIRQWQSAKKNADCPLCREPFRQP